MRFAFILLWKARWPVEVQCAVLEVSRSGYYAWRDRPVAKRTLEDAEVLVEIEAAYVAGRGSYGSPRVHRELRANGRRVGKKRVERLMRRAELAARKKRRFRKTTDSNHLDPIAPNVLQRTFDVPLTNAAWVTDVTYIWTHEGWLYLAAILDLFSRRVVGWAASANNDRALALGALDRASAARAPKAGLVHLALGIALSVFFWERGQPWSIGLIPGLMGIALLVAWKIESRPRGRSETPR